MTQLRKTFRPEFLNRVDEMILFRPLKAEDLHQIAYNLLKDVQKRLKEKEILFDFGEDILDVICREGYDHVNGARPLARTIQKLIMKPLSEKIIAGEFVPKDKVMVRINEGNIVFTKVRGNKET